MPAADKIAVQVDGRELTLTNLAKVLYPADGFTKAEVLDYYQRISAVLLPHIAGRPMTLKRYPRRRGRPVVLRRSTRPRTGRTGCGPRRSCRTARGRARPGRADQLPGHRRPARADLGGQPGRARAARADVAVPRAGDGARSSPPRARARARPAGLRPRPGRAGHVVECCRVAEALRPGARRTRPATAAKTSGGKGLQLYAPHQRPRPPSRRATLAKDVRGAAGARTAPARRIPDDQVAARRARCSSTGSQNNGSKTTIAPYSLRARDHPTVSTPVTWDEVEPAASWPTCSSPRPTCWRGSRSTATSSPRCSLEARADDLAAALGEQQQRVPGKRGVVDDPAVADHRLEFFPGHPRVPDAQLFRLGVGRSRLRLRGDK